MGGNGVHQQTGGVGRLTARHINAHAVQWGDLLAEQSAIFIAVAPALAIGLFLGLVVSAHPASRLLQGLPLGLGNGLQCRQEFRTGDFQGCHRGCLQAVKACGVLQHRRITPRLHIGQDVRHPLLNGGIGVAGPMQTGLEVRFKTGVGGGQASGCGGQGHGVEAVQSLRVGQGRRQRRR